MTQLKWLPSLLPSWVITRFLTNSMFKKNLKNILNFFSRQFLFMFGLVYINIFSTVSQMSAENLTKLQLFNIQNYLHWTGYWNRTRHWHCVKSVCIRSFSGLYFIAFGLNTDKYGLYSVRMREYTDQKNSKPGHFSSSLEICRLYLISGDCNNTSNFLHQK